MSLELKKRGDTWTFVVDIGRDPLTGKRKRKSKGGFKTKGECRAAASAIINEFNNGSYYDVKKLTFEEYINKYLNSVKSNLSYNTYDFYKYITNTHLIPAFGKMELTTIKPIHIQDFYTKSLNTVSGTTARHFHTFLKLVFNQAIKWQMININPCNYVNAPKNTKTKLNVWDEEQLNKFLSNTAHLVIYTPAAIAASTGMREGEICGLRWENIDLEKRIIYVKQQIQFEDGKLVLSNLKTPSSIRNITISKNLVDILNIQKSKQDENKEYFDKAYDDRDFVVCKNDGSPYNPKYISRDFRRVLKERENTVTINGDVKRLKLYEELDLPLIRFHDLRHTHATLLLKANVNPKVVSERLGHSSIKMTLDVYASVLPNMQKEAAEKIDSFFCPTLPTNCQQSINKKKDKKDTKA